jgi:hypothetical protein
VQQRFMLICGAADFAEKVGQVGLLGKSGKLRGVIQPHIEKALDAVSLQCAEELAALFWVKPML